MAFVTALPAVATDVVLPALGFMASEYKGASTDTISLVISLFFAGLGVGQLVFGPLCDSVGRRASIFIGLGLFILGSVICIFATTLNALLLGRFIQAFGASGPRIATMAIVRDQYEGNDMARIMSFIMMIFITVPMIAPSIGQLIIQIWNWHFVFIFLLIQAITTAIWLFFRQPETLPAESKKPIRLTEVANSFVAIIKIKSVLGYTLASGACFGLMVSYVSSSQHLFQNIYETGTKFPLYFAAISLSIGVASYVNGKLVRKHGMLKLVFLAMWLNMISSATLVLICIATDGVPHLLTFTTMMIVGFFGTGILMGNLTSLAMQPLGKIAGFGAAVISSISTFISVPFAIAVGYFLKDTITPFAVGLLMASCAAILCAYWASKHQ